MEKTKSIGKRKYNFEEEKLSFFESDFTEVKAYFQHKYSIYNRHLADKTKGWAEEKNNYIRSKMESAKIEVANKKAEKWKKAYDRMDECKLLCVHRLIEKVERDGDKLDADDILKILKALSMLESKDNTNKKSRIYFGMPTSHFTDGRLAEEKRRQEEFEKNDK